MSGDPATSLLILPTPPWKFRAGDSFGSFRLIRGLGEGPTKLWEAEDRRGRRVALKWVRPGRIDVFQARRYQEETSRALRGGNPGLVPLRSYGEREGLHYIVYDLIEGSETLARKICSIQTMNGPLPPDYWSEVAEFVADVADVLAVSHELGVLHGHLHPKNLLIDQDGHPMVTGYGLRILPEGSTLRYAHFYRSPERIRDDRHWDERSDVYSLGVILYELLFLRRPHEAEQLEELNRAILWQDPDYPTVGTDIPEALVRICARATEKRSSRRYLSMQAFSEDLRRDLAGVPVYAPGRSPVRRLWASLRWRAVCSRAMVGRSASA